MRSCETSCLKYVVFGFNLLFFVLSLVIITVGALALAALKQDSSEANVLQVIPIAVIVLGVIICLFSFLACCGAVSENRCMLITFAVLTSLLAILSLIMTILIFTTTTDEDDRLDNGDVKGLSNQTVSGIVMAVTFALELIGVVLASCLAAAIRSEGRLM